MLSEDRMGQRTTPAQHRRVIPLEPGSSFSQLTQVANLSPQGRVGLGLAPDCASVAAGDLTILRANP